MHLAHAAHKVAIITSIIHLRQPIIDFGYHNACKTNFQYSSRDFKLAQLSGYDVIGAISISLASPAQFRQMMLVMIIVR